MVLAFTSYSTKAKHNKIILQHLHIVENGISLLCARTNYKNADQAS
jgi:hypothetical protein